jgi:hypothetical protein
MKNNNLMKLIVKLLCLAALFMSGCLAVVADQPAYRSTPRPISPGPTYVWVGHSWVWDNRANVYVYREGYWTEPRRRSAVWVDGHWKQTRGGWKYVKGHWKY